MPFMPYMIGWAKVKAESDGLFPMKSLAGLWSQSENKMVNQDNAQHKAHYLKGLLCNPHT